MKICKFLLLLYIEYMKLSSMSPHQPVLPDFQSLSLIANLSTLLTSPSLTYIIHSITKFFYFYLTPRDELGDIFDILIKYFPCLLSPLSRKFSVPSALWGGLIRADNRIRCLSLKSRYILDPES